MYIKSSNSHSSHLISGFLSSFSLANLPFPETSKSFQKSTSGDSWVLLVLDSHDSLTQMISLGYFRRIFWFNPILI